MGNPIEDGSLGMDAALLLASAVDAIFASPPDDGRDLPDELAHQADWRRGVGWVAWLRDLFLEALDRVEKQRDTRVRLDGKVKPEAVAAAKAALMALAPHIKQQPPF